MTDEATVKVVPADTTQRRVYFEGPLKAAKAYLEAHFPRAHSDAYSSEPIHSAMLLHPDGDTQTFNAEEGWTDKAGDKVEPEPVAPVEPEAPVEPPVVPPASFI